MVYPDPKLRSVRFQSFCCFFFSNAPNGSTFQWFPFLGCFFCAPESMLVLHLPPPITLIRDLTTDAIRMANRLFLGRSTGNNLYQG